ncbi:MAG: hypothetical protein IKY33_03855 [Clostridia bacterium]|nr:hypothetical protein [Clostridia bacterium]
MKHLFIFNPRSLSGRKRKALVTRISEKCKGLEYEIYFSASAEDAQDKTRKACQTGEELCVYAGGGDGTIRQIAEALYPYPNAVLSAIPVGTGNDFVRNFGGKKAFLKLEHITDGEEHTIDLIQVGDKICANMINIGFDESVVSRLDKLRSLPLMGRSVAYTIALVIQLFEFPKEQLHITYADGSTYEKPFLLTFIANGKYCGGGYKSASEAQLDDGLLDMMTVYPLSRLSFFSLVGGYKNGTLITDPNHAHLFRFCKTDTVTLEKDTPFNVCIDGEVFSTNQLNVKALPRALRFRAPKEE